MLYEVITSPVIVRIGRGKRVVTRKRQNKTGILGWLGAEAGDDVGIAPFLARYGEMFGNWSGKILMSVGKSGGALAAAVLSLFRNNFV